MVERDAIGDSRQVEKTALLDQSLIDSIQRPRPAKSKALWSAITVLIALIVGLSIYLILR